MVISIGSDNTVTLTGLYDSVLGDYVNDATVTGTIYTDSGTSVGTFTLSYVAASDGDYRGGITASTSSTLTAGNAYSIRVVATSGSYSRTFSNYVIAKFTS
jgi:hypothetical protein